jgi:predicted membrane-bound dolichyl-phosphate-mannose-protein mannosyltransferase
MKNRLWQILTVILVLAIGFGAGIITYPYVFHVEEISTVVSSQILEPEDVLKLVKEREILYAIVDAQDQMISTYKKIVENYEEALQILMDIVSEGEEENAQNNWL